nr:hypothetical protein AH6.13 - Caenorhabditis elegans [Caenorhabditis elegans]
MSYVKCAPEEIIERFESIHQKSSQIVYLAAIISTFITTYFAIKVIFTQSFFEMSTKILLVQNLFYTNLYQLFYGFEAIGMLVRFKVRARFQKQQLIESTEAICYLTLSQFLAVFVNSSGLVIMSFIWDSMSIQLFYALIVWLYAFPVVALMFPVLLIYQIRKSRSRRALKIKEIKNEKQTQDDHIKQMTDMWT